MSVELNHTIVRASDRVASARFLAEILGLAVQPGQGHFTPVVLGNGVTLDYADADEVVPQHYAFLVDEATFDAAMSTLAGAGITYYAFPGHRQPGELNHRGGGRGVYFDDPDGHSMELMTVA